ncbi:hypothetical protein [Vibrio atypicus]
MQRTIPMLVLHLYTAKLSTICSLLARYFAIRKLICYTLIQ